MIINISYLDAFGLVLGNRNNDTIKPLFVCTKAYYWRAAARTMQMKAFRLNEYENCGKDLKYFEAFDYRDTKNFIFNDSLGFTFLYTSLKVFMKQNFVQHFDGCIGKIRQKTI